MQARPQELDTLLGKENEKYIKLFLEVRNLPNKPDQWEILLDKITVALKSINELAGKFGVEVADAINADNAKKRDTYLQALRSLSEMKKLFHLTVINNQQLYSAAISNLSQLIEANKSKTREEIYNESLFDLESAIQLVEDTVFVTQDAIATMTNQKPAHAKKDANKIKTCMADCKQMNVLLSQVQKHATLFRFYQSAATTDLADKEFTLLRTQ